ncbi:hypothetical protein RFI_19057 [Reticulomyxa filosa]|uniref:TLC domain-containing protein n=1 Tax=Reticulomyxa filosa TaxID=46433 RepID=X6MXL1_RETFI|nr:hypothetical protein RFI_19057 [Reticulomyxa filosa]|eukprot:ETO18222.1 hypothetical protein RFI_19057 [Reticulomyxa filosa]
MLPRSNKKLNNLFSTNFRTIKHYDLTKGKQQFKKNSGINKTMRRGRVEDGVSVPLSELEEMTSRMSYQKETTESQNPSVKATKCESCETDKQLSKKRGLLMAGEPCYEQYATVETCMNEKNGQLSHCMKYWHELTRCRQEERQKQIGIPKMIHPREQRIANAKAEEKKQAEFRNLVEHYKKQINEKNLGEARKFDNFERKKREASTKKCVGFSNIKVYRKSILKKDCQIITLVSWQTPFERKTCVCFFFNSKKIPNQFLAMPNTPKQLSTKTFITYWESVTAPWKHGLSVALFLCGCLFFYLTQEFGCWLCRQYFKSRASENGSKKKEPATEQEKEREAAEIDKFGNSVMSVVHCCVMIIGCTPYVLCEEPTEVVPSNQSYQLSFGITMLYKFACNWSQAYLVTDSLTYIRKYWVHSDNRIMLIHHVCLFVSLCPGALLIYDSVPYEGLFISFTYFYVWLYISSASYMVEYSTLFLNAKHFAKFFNLPVLYFFSGACLVIAYPLLRNVWLAYVIYYTYNSSVDITYTRHSKGVALFAQIFVYLMSLFYFFTCYQFYKRLKKKRRKIAATKKKG